jgi:acetolactate decarboxylase
MRRMRTLACAALFAALFLSGCAPRDSRDTLHQVSTFSCLLDGGYEGETDLGELRRHGDLGLGTFEDLDGEMVLLDGRPYQIKSDGRAYAVDNSVRTPFACVTFFDADETLALPEGTDYEAFRKLLDEKFPTARVPYAIRVTGTFKSVKTRSVPKQRKPYPRLAEVVKNQPTFELTDVAGTLVGFCLPKSMEGVNVPGCHLHFLSADRSAGGHVLAFAAREAKLELDDSPELKLVMPRRNAPAAAPAVSPHGNEIERVEK